MIKTDKYGFILYATERNNENAKKQLDLRYANEITKEDVTFTHEFVSKGLFKTLKKYKELENKFRDYNIVQGIALIINSRYGYMRRFNDEKLESDILDYIPNSLILDNNAIKELLSNLRQENKHLIVYIGDYIKDRRKRLEKEKLIDLEENKEIYDKYDQIKEEFGL